MINNKGRINTYAVKEFSAKKNNKKNSVLNPSQSDETY